MLTGPRHCPSLCSDIINPEFLKTLPCPRLDPPNDFGLNFSDKRHKGEVVSWAQVRSFLSVPALHRIVPTLFLCCQSSFGSPLTSPFMSVLSHAPLAPLCVRPLLHAHHWGSFTTFLLHARCAGRGRPLQRPARRRTSGRRMAQSSPGSQVTEDVV